MIVTTISQDHESFSLFDCFSLMEQENDCFENL